MLFAFEFPSGLVAFATDLFQGRVGGVELLAELADHGPHAGEFVAVIERLGEHRRLVEACLSGSVGADTVGIGTPFAWPAAFAGDRHHR